MLYIVSTPIGNLKDMTLRALETLKEVDVIACEDTRLSGTLLKHFDIKSKLVSYHDHSSDKERENIIEMLKNGKNVALISDAGSPMIADPGYKLVRRCIEEQIKFTTIPGVSSVIAGLQLSGQTTDSFFFGGFLPAKDEAKKKQLETEMQMPCTLIYFETANRASSTLEILEKLAPERRVSIVREITKMFEEVRLDTSENLLVSLKEKPIKGEVVLLIEGKPSEQKNTGDIEKQLQFLLKGFGLKEASQYLAEQTGVSKKIIYDLGLKLKGDA